MKKKEITNRVRNELNKVEDYKKRSRGRIRKKTAEELKLLINPEDTPQNPLTYHRLMEWLADTGWVYGYIRKRISPMGEWLYEDYAQSIWLCILEVKQETIMRVWYTGKGAFVNYIKMIIDTQLKSVTCANYYTNQRFHNTHCLLTDSQWRAFEEGHPDSFYEDAFPVRCESPTGNIKKMITVEHDTQPIRVKYDFDLIEEQ